MIATGTAEVNAAAPNKSTGEAGWAGEVTVMAHETPRALALAAIRHETTERIPFHCMLSPPAQYVLQEHLGSQPADGYLDCCLALFGCADKPLYATPARYGDSITDKFGVVWSTSDRDRGYPVAHPLTRPTLAGYEFPDPREPARWARVAATSSRHHDRLRLAVIGDL